MWYYINNVRLRVAKAAKWEKGRNKIKKGNSKNEFKKL
tara:strand:+ start:603 stop:716 length:114 start_codon:yes stop_codon:yes gene_type:complete